MLGNKLITEIPEGAVDGLRLYYERSGQGQNFWIDGSQAVVINEEQRKALKESFLKKQTTVSTDK